MALLRSGAPSMRRAERSGGGDRRLRAAATAGTPPKKKIDSAAAWREFRELIWVHRRRLSIGLTLMMISRLAGIVLPALSKYVIDDVIGEGPHELLVPIALAAGAATIVQALTSLRAVTDPRRRRAARDHRHAQTGAGQDHAAAGALLRFDANRRAAVAHHERRRRHPQSRRHRPGAAGRRHRHRDHRPRRAVVSQLAHDARHGGRARPVRRRHGVRVPAAAAALPRARQDPARKSPAG